MNDERKEEYRIKEIIALGKHRGFLTEAAAAVNDETSVEAFRNFILSKVSTPKPVGETSPELGLSPREADSYSMRKAILFMSNPSNPAYLKDAAFEREVSDEFGKLTKHAARGLFVPPDVLKRDLTVGTDAAGGHLVGTEILPQSFIESLHNKAVLMAAGATIIDDLIGDVAIPKQSGGAVAYWLAEGDSITESQQTFAQLVLSPKTLGGMTEYSRKLVIQSSISVENFIRNDLARVLAIALDTAGLHGTGSNNQPTGIAATSGIGSVAGGTNGAAPVDDDIIDLETEVAQDNADVGNLNYITNTKVRGKLKKTFISETHGDRRVWDNRSAATPLNGHKALVTNSVSSTLTKGTASGVCSGVFFGNWADLIIALWSGIDLLVDPYSGSASGKIRVTAFQSADIGVRHAESFAAMLDALT